MNTAKSDSRSSESITNQIQLRNMKMGMVNGRGFLLFNIAKSDSKFKISNKSSTKNMMMGIVKRHRIPPCTSSPLVHYHLIYKNWGSLGLLQSDDDEVNQF